MSVTRNPNLGPSHIRAKRRRLFYIRSVIVLFSLAIIIFVLAIFSGHHKVVIKQIIVLDNVSVSNEAILEIVNREIAGRYWYLFARNDYLIFPRFKIKESILAEIKTIKEVDISWDTWQVIEIKVLERKPHSVWCSSDEIDILENNCFFVDKEGYVYSRAPVFSGSMFIRTYGNILDEDPVGQSFLPSETYRQLFRLVDLLEDKKLKTIKISFNDPNFTFSLENGPVIKFNLKQKLEDSFGNLFLALEEGSLDLENGAKSIAYIDLRFSNKIVIGKKEIKNE